MKQLISCLLFVAWLSSPAQAGRGPSDKATAKVRQLFLDQARFAEIQRVASDPAMAAIAGYRVLATQPLGEAQSRDLLAQFRQLPLSV